ncbi:MAG: hypothetical protein ACREA2_14265 [Blastocatellia bacterium]
MNTDRRKRTIFRLRAATAALALLLGWLGPVLPLAASESDVCMMECCVAEGHCCCAARKPFVKGQVPGADGEPVISERELTASCPPRCVQPASGSHHLQFPKAAVVKYAGEVNVSQSIYAQAPRFARDALADDPAAPRAPPIALL